MITHLSKQQPNVVQTLNNSFEKGRFHHAYLFEGPKGTGKFSLALEVAKMVLCPNGLCGTCKTCKQIDALQHPNVIVVSPDGASIKKEQIKDLISELNKTALVEGNRVYIINHIDKMTTSAANSLLKYFEEPHDNIHAILITEQIGQILATIKSRAQVLTFKKVSERFITESLLEAGINEEYASIAPYVTNNLDEAKKLCESEDFQGMLDLIFELGNIIANQYHNQLLYYRDHSQMITRQNVDLFLDLLIYYFKDILNYQLDQELIFINNRSLKMLRNMNQQQVIETIEFMMKERSNLYFNPNIDLLMDRVLMKLDWRD